MRIIKTNLCVVALLLLTLAASHAQVYREIVMNEDPISVDAQIRKDVIDSISKIIRERYIYPDRAEEVINKINNKFNQGNYDVHSGAIDFANALTADLRRITSDLHFGVTLQSKLKKQPASSCTATCTSPVLQKSSNYGFKTVKLLDGNIGYLEMTMFIDTASSRPTAEAAMQFLSGMDALIIDLRSSLGGFTSVGQLLAGYFMEPNTELHTTYNGATDKTQRISVLEPSKANPQLDLPVFILTGPVTASAAEAFAYDLKHLGRATIIGERTAGAGHCANLVEVDFPEFTMEFMIPVDEPIHPVTKSNWEGTGVEPDIKVPAREALAKAHQQALHKLASNIKDPGESWALEWASLSIKKEYYSFELSQDALAEYIGNYGPRRINLTKHGLEYNREGFAGTHRLIPLDTDIFGLEGVDILRLRFDRDKTGKIIKLTGLYDRGNQDSHSRIQ